ncbi:MAG: transposase [Thermodesulfobacteriota bacterium]
MPRQARLDAPGIVHHIIIRGIERRKIFLDARDYDDFLDRLATLLPETRTLCYAWALLPNHAHFLFRTGTVPIATLMRRLLTGYAVTFNLRHSRVGRLFQNRYKSIICQESAYLKELVRYIHLNPLRASLVGDVNELNRYSYCGHNVMMGLKNRSWQDTDHVFGYFGSTLRSARKSYFDYLEEGIARGRQEDLTDGGFIRSLGGWSEVQKQGSRTSDHGMVDERILGDESFADSVINQAAEEFHRRYELKRRGYDLDRIAERVADILRISKKEVFAGGRQAGKVKARDMLCYWAVREAGMSVRSLARRLDMSPPGVGYAAERGAAIIRENDYILVE